MFVSSSSNKTFVKIGEGNKRGEGDFSYHISSISGLGNFFVCFFIIKLLSKLELTFQECQNGLLCIIRVTSPIYNYFTLLFLKRNKQKVYGHSLADSRRILKIVYRYGKCNVWNVFATENVRWACSLKSDWCYLLWCDRNYCP